MKDLKYLFAYIVPGVIFLSLYLRGSWVFLAIGVLFGLIPALEQFMPGTEDNFSPSQEERKKNRWIFDILLYLNVPVQYGLLFYFLYLFRTPLTPGEMAGMILSMGIACGSLGINVAHELGHRPRKFEQRMSQALLLTSLYLHFFIEHNRGHHKYVATPLDPATARKGESLYAFWMRSIRDGYYSAWNLEKQRLQKLRQPVVSWANQMLRFQIIQIGFLVVIGLCFGFIPLLAFLGAALVGILELETVNYLEHYGLLRKEIKTGVYERVLPRHSWNTNRTLGRIMLYELTRHSDHHYLASRKYQILRHFDESPQLPQGYPGMMVLAMFPPLWFRVMHRQLEKIAS
ncbi:MAG: alkane 1-monooxygenase [Bacteroidia bacterium]|nr:alkane 1-monooxygenase [Bacteroidia bacterium]